MKIPLIIACFLAAFTTTFSQGYFSYRILVENALVVTSSKTSIMYLNGHSDETQYPKENGYCAGMGFSVNYNINEENAIDLRAGYIFANFQDYSGPEFGLNYQRQIVEKLSILAGVKAHIAFPENPDRTEHTVTFAGLGMEYNINQIFAFEILYYKSLSNLYYRGGMLPVGTSVVHHDLRFSWVLCLN